MFNTMKSAAAKMAINNMIEGIGRIGELQIDNSTRTIIAVIELDGEEQPVRIEVQGYALGADHLTLGQFVCSRQWLATACNRYLANKEIKLPARTLSAIAMVL